AEVGADGRGHPLVGGRREDDPAALIALLAQEAEQLLVVGKERNVDARERGGPFLEGGAVSGQESGQQRRRVAVAKGSRDAFEQRVRKDERSIHIDTKWARFGRRRLDVIHRASRRDEVVSQRSCV